MRNHRHAIKKRGNVASPKPGDQYIAFDPPVTEKSLIHAVDPARGWRIVFADEPVVVNGAGPYATFADNENKTFYVFNAFPIEVFEAIVANAFNAGFFAGRLDALVDDGGDQ